MAAKDNQKIIIYSTAECRLCRIAKSYLLTLGVGFVEKDVWLDRQAKADLLRLSGQSGVPLIDISGALILGFDRTIIDSALRRAGLI